MYVILILVFTLRTNAFQHKIGGVKREAIGQNDLGHCHIVKTKGALALLTIEMYVKVRQLVIVRLPTSAILLAKRIFRLPTSVLYLVHNVLV